MAHMPNNSTKSSAQYRQKALQEIRISLLPFINIERSTSSASSTTSDSSSSQGHVLGLLPSINSSTNVSYSCNPQCSNNSNSETSATSSGNSEKDFKVSQLLLNLGFTQKFLSNLSIAQQQQLAQQLQTLPFYNSNSSSIHPLQQPFSYPHSPASISSLYSPVSSPPYAASSSSGRLSPTPTISSTSEYSSMPPSLQLQKLLSSASSTCSSQNSCLRNPNNTVNSVVSSIVKTSQLQAWSARHAKSQSPVIMQSVKSTQVQKPVLQTAVAPSAPSSNSSLNYITSNSSLSYPISTSNVTISLKSKLLPPSAVLPSNPPPYSSNNANISSSAQMSLQIPIKGQSSTGMPPPPSYISAVQQKQQQINTYNNKNSGLEEFIISPQPPPPPYIPILSSKETDVASKYSTNSGRQNLTSITSIPTTDPPSYASSVASITAQKLIAPISLPISSTTLCNNSQTKSINFLNNNQLPARPPPPLPPNSDLVNTVESICVSQVSAIHNNNGPPLPPKPATLMQFSDASSIINATESECSSNSTSTCNITFLPTSNGPRRPAPPPPPQVSSQMPSPPLPPPPPSPPPFLAKSSTQTPPSPPSPSTAYSTCNSSEKDYIQKTTHQSPVPQRKPLSKEKEQERRETKVKNYSPAAFKFFMEQHVENIIKSQKERERRRQQLENEMAIVGLSESAQAVMRKILHRKESNYIRLKRAKMKKSMFVKIATIGVGAFGEVALVRKEDTNQLYAMKTLRKTDVLKRNQVAHVKAERDILAEAENDWVVKLYYSFQDSHHLYFVMDYIPGGDLMSLLIKFGIFEEKLARFYIVELVLAIESVHKMSFIHRDIKPDNILIDIDGHIKLTDFGLCTGFRWTHNSKYYQINNGVDHSRQDSMEILDENWPNQCHCGSTIKPLERRRKSEHQRCQAHSLVGTPNYIAPEVLMRTGYSQSCDWWSVGVILYEMLVGQPPFLANTSEETQNKVIQWKTTLKIPEEAKMAPEARDLILKLCCGPEERLGKNGADEIKKHPFFSSINFESDIRKQPAPHIPQIRYPTDTSNFDPIDPEKLHPSSEMNDDENINYENDFGSNGEKLDNEKHPEHAFFEFTFRRFFEGGNGGLFPMSSLVQINGDDSSTTESSSNENDQASPVYV